MTIEILNTNFEFVDYLYEYESFIWVDRFNKPGDFEIYAPAKSSIKNLLKRNYYVKIDVSEHMMIIEDIVWESSAESGDHVKATGRSLESILDRRIVWGEYTMPATESGDIQTEVFRLFNKQIIDPKDFNGVDMPERRIDIFTYKRDDEVPFITEYYPSGQFKGTSILSIIETLADEFKLGWKITYRKSDGKLVFKFFDGVDRTILNPGENGFVIFAPEYNNIIESTYSDISSERRNVMLIGGTWPEEEEDPEHPGQMIKGEDKPIYEAIGQGEGLSRREMYYESNVDKHYDDPEEEMSYEEYIDAMRSEGGTELSKYKLINNFDGKYETNYQFKYGKDFFIGDRITVRDVFGHTAPARVTEFIRSINISNGEEAYPTFEIIQDEYEE